MNKCKRSKKEIFDFIEKQLSVGDSKRFAEHLKGCKDCQNEYKSLQRLYEVMDSDDLVLPEKEYFEKIKLMVRQRPLALKKFGIRDFVKIFVPIFATAAIMLFLIKPVNNTVGMIIPVSTLIEDEDIALMTIDKIVDEELKNDMTIIEDYLPASTDYDIDELTIEEKDEFINNLIKKYGVSI